MGITNCALFFRRSRFMTRSSLHRCARRRGSRRSNCASLATRPWPASRAATILSTGRSTLSGSELRWRSGLRAVLTKRIPAGRGLGGGSSDAAAALKGFLVLTGKSISEARLAEIASRLGADIPFFLHGGRALGIGRGDEIYPLPDIPRFTVLVVSPRDVAVPTPDAYRWLSRRLTKRRDATRLMQFCALCWSPQGNALSNDFEGAVFPRFPRLARIKRELLLQGAAEAALAGSGSAVFGIFRNPAHARRAARAFPKDQVFVCSSLSRAEYRRKAGGPAFA